MTNGSALIRAELERRGYTILWCDVADSKMVMCFDLMANPELPWQRAFYVDEDKATPDAFERALNDWKADVLARMHSGDASPTLIAVAQAYGDEKMAAALTRREGMH